MLFRIGEKEYSGESAVDIVHALQLEMLGGQRQQLSLREFLLWSMSQMRDRIPLRELDVSDKLSNETLALNYLYLRDEYGAGQLSGVRRQDVLSKGHFK
jgi:hypothetical protein